MRRWAGQDIYTHTHARVQNEYLGCEDIVLLADGPCATIPFNDICTYDCIAVVSSKKSMYRKTPPHECFSGAHRSGGSCQPRWRQSSNPHHSLSRATTHLRLHHHLGQVSVDSVKKRILVYYPNSHRSTSPRNAAHS